MKMGFTALHLHRSGCSHEWGMHCETKQPLSTHSQHSIFTWQLSLDFIQFTNFRKWQKPECRKWKALASVKLNKLWAHCSPPGLQPTLQMNLDSSALPCVCLISPGRLLGGHQFSFIYRAKLLTAWENLWPLSTAPWDLAAIWYLVPLLRYFSHCNNSTLQWQNQCMEWNLFISTQYMFWQATANGELVRYEKGIWMLFFLHQPVFIPSRNSGISFFFFLIHLSLFSKWLL